MDEVLTGVDTGKEAEPTVPERSRACVTIAKSAAAQVAAYLAARRRRVSGDRFVGNAVPCH